jgi:hypothetical protein
VFGVVSSPHVTQGCSIPEELEELDLLEMLDEELIEELELEELLFELAEEIDKELAELSEELLSELSLLSEKPYELEELSELIEELLGLDALE